MKKRIKVGCLCKFQNGISKHKWFLLPDEKTTTKKIPGMLFGTYLLNPYVTIIKKGAFWFKDSKKEQKIWISYSFVLGTDFRNQQPVMGWVETSYLQVI